MSTNRPSLILYVLAILMLAASIAYAGRVKCPVCGQVFSDEIKTCPNDGSNLELEGQPVDDAPEPKAEDDTDEEADPNEKSPKYKRSERIRKNKENDSGYQDRKSRFSVERRGPDAAQERKKRQRERDQLLFEEQDKTLLLAFNNQRESVWEDRQLATIQELRIKNERDRAGTRLLYSMGAPLTSGGSRLFFMAEGTDSGPVLGAEVEFNLARYRLRAGFSSFVGVRSLSNRDDLVFLEHVTVGFQYPWRYSPYIVARGGVGVLASERFGENVVYMMKSIGVEIGLDCWLTPWIALTPSVGYEMSIVDSAYWNSFTAKVSIGF